MNLNVETHSARLIDDDKYVAASLDIELELSPTEYQPCDDLTHAVTSITAARATTLSVPLKVVCPSKFCVQSSYTIFVRPETNTDPNPFSRFFGIRWPFFCA